MSMYLGKGVSSIFGSEGYNYSKVVFSKGRPPLDSELNLLQEVLEQQARRSTMEMPSGWVSFRDAAASKSASDANSFYTQSAEGATTEIALVNGWPVVVAGTGTNSSKVNKVNLSSIPLVKGSRADGVFLEVWRALVSEEMQGITQPVATIADSSIYGVFPISESVCWAVGANGAILKTANGGLTWNSQPSPVSTALRSVAFREGGVIGYAVGDHGVVLCTDNGGAQWKRLQVPSTEDILSLCLVGETSLWLSGTNGLLLYSVDGQNLVAPEASITGESLRSIYFYDKLVGWAVGDSGALLKSQDGGRTWVSLPISTMANGVETAISTRLNAVSFANLNDGWIVGHGGLILKTSDGGIRWSDVSTNIVDSTTGGYTRSSDDLLSICVRRSLPHEFTIRVFDPGYFSDATYQINATSIVLYVTRRGDGYVLSRTLQLAEYPTSDSLLTALNSLSSDDGRRLFIATHDYSVASYSSHANQGTFGASSAIMRFAIGDSAWVTGTYGTVLSTGNSGAQWRQESTGSLRTLLCSSVLSSGTGWFGGNSASILKLSNGSWSVQATDLSTNPQKKVYYEGNAAAAPSLNMNFDSIDPSIKIATADRVQIQYRIRVVEGVDLGSYQEAGLGAPYVYSRGPNTSVRSAGSFSFENMGQSSGDYGLWRARCKNTVDGYSYAIPMFLVTQRNSSAYDPVSNVNGSTDPSSFVVRPDDISSGEVRLEDIVDLRKTVATVDASSVLMEAVEALLSNRLSTKMSRDASFGSQVGAVVMHKDVFDTESGTAALIGGSISSSAVFGLTGFAGPSDGAGIEADTETGALPSQEDLTFPEYPLSLWDPRPESYSAVYSGTGLTGVDGTAIPGGFTGYGSTVAKFVMGATGVLSGVEYPGLRYVIAGQRIDCSSEGLSNSPDKPLSLRNPDARSSSKTAYYRSVHVGSEPSRLYEATSSVGGKVDYVEAVPSVLSSASSSSAVKVHRFLKTTVSTNVVRVPKSLDGYTSLCLESLVSTDGTIYRVKEVRDREMTSSSVYPNTDYLVAYLDDAYRIPAGTVVEAILGAVDVPPAGADAWVASLGLSTSDRGESTDSFRNSALSLVDSRTKSIGGVYRTAILYSATTAGSASVTLSTGGGSLIVGLPTMPTANGASSRYAWYTTASLEQFGTASDVWWSTVPVDGGAKVTGLGTSTVKLTLKSGPGGIGISTSGSILVPVLVKDVALVNSAPTSSAEVYYKTVVPQTVDSLPSKLSLDILHTGGQMYVSNFGNGGGMGSLVYQGSLLRHLPITDSSFLSESLFHNLLGMRVGGIYEEGGLLTLPMHVISGLGGGISLSSPSSDSYGRTFYRNSGGSILLKAASMSVATPRQLFVPVLARVTSNVVSPFLRGEVVLLVFSQTKNTDLSNTILMGPSSDKVACSLYRVPGMPLLKV